ncbi:DUF7522 family protein [Halobacterium wangiae]|uniref:DUF7522 family protein n=1 Tax=Halobacterium wangiae TaxID=2902623 RepID=UPI001E48B395|nr:hypothetical protein [Halobacterium wangiae]
MTEARSSLVDSLHEHVDDSLRIVGYHGGNSWTVDYVREDLQGTYETDVVDEIADDLLLNVVANERQETLYELGDMRATVRLFDQGFVVHVPLGQRDGCLVSVDDDADVRGRELVELVRRVEA